MKVEIVSATEKDPVSAAALLIFTKHTRLQMDGSGLADIQARCVAVPDWMLNELVYMAKTIRSSWEFLDVTFAITNVSRACAQQITRTRFTPIDGDLFGSYAMQSQRVTDMSSSSWHVPDRIASNEEVSDHYSSMMQEAMSNYRYLTQTCGAKLEDARGVLPVNLHCNLVAKYNLRMLVDLIHARTSYRAQDEFNELARKMREALVAMWPWAEIFLQPRNAIAKDLVAELRSEIVQQQAGSVPVDYHKLLILLAKVEDQIEGGK